MPGAKVRACKPARDMRRPGDITLAGSVRRPQGACEEKKAHTPRGPGGGGRALAGTAGARLPLVSDTPLQPLRLLREPAISPYLRVPRYLGPRPYITPSLAPAPEPAPLSPRRYPETTTHGPRRLPLQHRPATESAQQPTPRRTHAPTTLRRLHCAAHQPEPRL